MAKLFNYVIDTEYKWYPVYTRLNHEKAVESCLINKGVEVFLPKRKMLKEWADRKKLIYVPLFSQYLFVRICHKEFYNVLQTPSLLHFIMFDGKASFIPDYQIEMIKEILSRNIGYDLIVSRIEQGHRVIIKEGPLAGYRGDIVTFRGSKTIQLAIDNLNYSILVNLEENMIALCE